MLPNTVSANGKEDTGTKRPLVLDVFGTPKSNIDRRQCSRVVPLKVLCLGLSRTGTQCKSRTRIQRQSALTACGVKEV